jgi:hypothetical protein
VSPRKALRLATEMKESLFRRPDLTLQSLSLEREQDTWVWSAHFVVNRKAPDGVEYLTLFVLMDGTVPRPVEVDPKNLRFQNDPLPER